MKKKKKWLGFEQLLIRCICLQKKQVASARASDQKSIDQTVLASVKNEEFLSSYLATSFYLRNGDKPHEMKW